MRIKSAVIASLVVLFSIQLAVAQQNRSPQKGKAPAGAHPAVDALPSAASPLIAIAPCRLVDTRLANGPYGGPSFTADSSRSFNIPANPCNVPLAAAYSLNITVARYKSRGFLTAYPTGGTVPGTSTLNFGNPPLPPDNPAAIANAAIVPADPTGSISIYVFSATDVIIDINGYFPEGVVTGVSTSGGLIGGGTGSVSLSIANHGVAPLKIDPTGAIPGQALMFNGTDAAWTMPPQGTITAVNAGTGMTGGGTSGPVTLSTDFAPSGGLNGTATTVARSDHQHFAQTVIVNPGATAVASGSNLLAALAGILDASATKPYLLKIAPGIYDVANSSLAMKAYVDIEGSGELATRITGTWAGFGSGVLVLAENAELRFLTVEDHGPAGVTTAIAGNGVSSSVYHVTAKNSGGNGSSFGVAMTSGITPSTPLFTDVTILVDGGTGNATGFQSENLNNTPILDRVRITASSGNTAIGIYDNLSKIVARNSTVVASTAAVGGTAYGIYNTGTLFTMNSSLTASTADGVATALSDANASSTITNCQLRATSSTGFAFGINNSGSAGSFTVLVDTSQIEAATSTVGTFTASYTVRVGASRLSGGATVGTMTCAGVYDENYVFSASTCP